MKRYLFLSLLLVTAFSFVNFTPTPTGYQVGDKATDFLLKNVDGKMVSLHSYPNAKGFIVAFTCNHCPFAKRYEARIMALDQQYAAKGYPVIAISSNDPVTVPEDSPDSMVTRAKLRNYTFPYLFDETQEIAKTYGATNTPHLFVIQRIAPGFVVRYIGSIDDNAEDASKATKHYVEDAVNALLAGQPVAVEKTKAIGCGIKWKKQS